MAPKSSLRRTTQVALEGDPEAFGSGKAAYHRF